MHDDGIIINGVVVPKLVADQLRQLGVSLSWYSKGQLEAAINGCSVDCNLIDDPDGANFFDDLKLDEHEREENEGEIDIDPYRRNKLNSLHGSVFAEPDEPKHSPGEFKRSLFYDPTFRERIKSERERDRERRKEMLSGGSENKSESIVQHHGA